MMTMTLRRRKRMGHIHGGNEMKVREHVQYSTVQYSTVQYSTVQYSTVQYSRVKVGAVCGELFCGGYEISTR
jgi:hypothetical protein